MAGLQCHKLLWWMAHEPAAPELEIDESRQAVFDQGHRVGALARTYVPGGVLIDLPYNAYEQRLEATRWALAQGAPAVYEAAFRADGVFVSVDILERLGLERLGAEKGRGFCLTEVKSTTSVKEQHLPDVAVQTHVLRRSGLDVGRMEVMHLNRGCAYPDLSNLFVRADVTETVETRLGAVPREIAAMTAMLAGALPSVATGPHCSTPYECPFTERCWPVLPAHHVSTLYAMRRRALELDELGYRTIFDLPEDFPLGAAADRQRRAVQAGHLIVEPTLAAALARFAPPVAFLDFETVGLAIPVWDGCHPYDAVPVQFSAYVPDEGGALRPHAWLADGPVTRGRRWPSGSSPCARAAPAPSSPTMRASRATGSGSSRQRCRTWPPGSRPSRGGWWTCCPWCAITFIIRTSAAASRSSACCPRWCMSSIIAGSRSPRARRRASSWGACSSIVPRWR